MVYLVLHYEIIGEPHYVDEMIFYVCSSLEKAVEFIKTSKVSEWSWWEIQEQEVDLQEWPNRIGLYNRLGDKIEAAPIMECTKIFNRIGFYDRLGEKIDVPPIE